MAEKKTTKKKLMKGKGKYARIKNNMERWKSNLLNVLQSSGVAAAKRYVDETYKKHPEVVLNSFLTRTLNKRNETARKSTNTHKARRSSLDAALPA